MYKKSILLSLFVAIVFLCSTVYGADNDVLAGMGKKITRGFVNILTGWLELPAQTVKGYNNTDNKAMGIGVGIVKGIGYGIGRTGWGVVELAGFWAVSPEDNKRIGIPLDDEYAWQEGDPYDWCDPSFGEAAVNPICRKFLRGLGNGLFGFAELPGQIAKGTSEKAWDYGILKGLWFWYSRELYGIAEMATAVFPNPEDNPGYSFEQEYAWDALVDEIEE